MITSLTTAHEPTSKDRLQDCPKCLLKFMGKENLASSDIHTHIHIYIYILLMDHAGVVLH